MTDNLEERVVNARIQNELNSNIMATVEEGDEFEPEW
jgi:hypothetical protein